LGLYYLSTIAAQLMYEAIQSVFSGYIIGHARRGSFKAFFSEEPFIFSLLFMLDITMFMIFAFFSYQTYKRL
jgi:hypothetical protein